MIELNQLLFVYIRQYKEESRKKRKLGGRPRDLRERISRLHKTMKRTKNTQVTTKILEDWHHQIRNLSYFSYRSRDDAAIRMIEAQLLPELNRLDLAMFLPTQKDDLSMDFLAYLEQELSGEICRRPLLELYQEYKRYIIEYKIMDLVPSRPELEFPETMAMNRRFILHIGPTNSGKTFHALERLKLSRCGVYLGPLRLLALEVYEKMHDYGVPCTMLTGQECLSDDGSRITASTIEMADFSAEYDIAVIDEAQLTADPDRGHCWTKAILGLRAHEIHICMSPAAEQVVTHLIHLCGDQIAICRYERKTSLLCENTPFSFPESVRPGDALVVFSKKSVLDVAGRLEEEGIRASVIYGSLPPEIRRRQMQLFTRGKTNVVVATDAIGMGLNLPVRRIVFVQKDKFDGISRRGLTAPEVKQIAGRAGRFGLFDIGYVNAVGEEALSYIRERLQEAEPPIEKVSLGFPQILLDLDEPLDVILNVWKSVEPSPPFEKVSIDETLSLYAQAERCRDSIYGFEDKRILYRMISCPIDVDDRQVVAQWLRYCKEYPADTRLRHPEKNDGVTQGLQKYETYYRKLDLYYQFSQRFDKMIDEEWLERERVKTEGTIMQFLSKGKGGYIARCQRCGRLLPLGYPFRICDSCFQTGKKYGNPRHLAETSRK
jgi:ATP-dependent RNA helicase SUPV3L1/SUV3